jgi:3-dehydroquinate dehydratase-2
MNVLVIHGAGMNMRGKVQQDIFGTMTLPQYEQHIASYAGALGIAVRFFHSNIEGEVVDALYEAFDGGVDGCIINPAGYTTLQGPLRAAIAQMRFPVVEVHLSNPAARGAVSAVQPVCKASVYGFGIAGYRLALEGLKALTGK